MARFTLDLQKNKKQAAIFVTLLAVVLLVGYLNFFLIPQTASAVAALKGAAKLGREVAVARADIARTPALRKDLDAYSAKIERYVKMLPVEAEVPAFLESLSAMARDANVKIVAIAPVPGKETESPRGRIYQEMPIQINARSGYHELGRFLANLENSDRFMKVVDIEIRSDKASPKRHDVDLLLLTYVLLQGK